MLLALWIGITLDMAHEANTPYTLMIIKLKLLTRSKYCLDSKDTPARILPHLPTMRWTLKKRGER